ncbi:PrsW family intramembrane metalloprotease [Fuchsiella alkaliacetigena]|uniref:PrsW family intramembrane metalloprotease n=1 Tax=Fuchsiella alkaliacetigena TaxID=957042 RepID=UPI00200B58E7|nr:PrsW family glutamic-type intramembrane protease [Fuchsiella alkaliacetigena]MCK8824425.1 PrsW family glutamic-type intramembrane protease [Fuchsiella alkaliacetigena]
MRVLTLLIVSILPGLLWIYFFYRQDKYEAEPFTLILKTFFLGAVTVIPAGLIELPFSDLIATTDNLLILLILSIFVIGLVEEVLKIGVVYLFIYPLSEFNEVMDGVIYGISAGLGFAAIENLFYTIIFGYQVGVMRAFVTTVVHASFSGIAGYYLGLAKKTGERRLIIIGLIQVVLLHGIYDFLIISDLLPSAAILGLVIAFYLYLAKLIRQAQELSPFKP